MKTILAILFFAGAAQAGVPYWQAPMASTSTAYGTGRLAGILDVYPATTTAAASPAIMLDGVNRQITARNGAAVSTMSSTGFYGNGSGLTNATNAAYAAALSTAVFLPADNAFTGSNTMSGPLTVSNSVTVSSFTATGNARINGSVGVGEAPAYAKFHIQGTRTDTPGDVLSDYAGTYGVNMFRTGTSNDFNLDTYYTGTSGAGFYNGMKVLNGAVSFPGSAFSVGGSTLVVAGSKSAIGLLTNESVSGFYPGINLGLAPADSDYSAYSIADRSQIKYYYASSAPRYSRILDISAGGYEGDGTTGGGEIRFLTKPSVGATALSRLAIINNGNVGIGTTAPGSGIGGNGVKFEVATNDTAESSEIIVSNNSTADGYITGSLESYSGSSDNKRTAGVFFATDGSNVTDANGQIRFYTSNAGTLAQKAVITKGGNVGIGTTAPEYRLDLAESGADLATNIIRLGAQNSAGESGIIWKPEYAGYTKISAYIKAVTGGGGFFQDDLVFGTKSIGDASTDATESMRIRKTGYVGIGDPAPQAMLTVAQNIHSSGTISAVNFVGSGVGLTGLPGGGDAVLAATQTFTGVNTIKPNYAVWIDSKAAGVAGGSSQSDDWHARDLTVEIADTGDIGTLTASSVTLAAGTYFCEWSSPFYGGLAYQTRLRNVTAGSTIQAGSSGYCDNTSLPHCVSNGMARFTLTGSTSVSLQYIVSGAKATNGLGYAAAWGEASIFSILKCTKER